MAGVLPDDWSEANLAHLRSLPDIDLWASDPLVIASRERQQRLAFEAQRGELARMLQDVLHAEILFEVDRAFASNNTRSSYKSDFVRFRAWCVNEKLPYLPTSPEVLAHYIIEAAAGGLRLKRLERIVAAVAFIHHLKDAPFRSA